MEKTTYINFFSLVWPPSVGALMNIISQKIQQGVEKIVLLISSPGGNVNSGLTLYSFLKRIPIELDTFNYESVDSIAVAVFCAGKKRFCVKDGKFFMHELQYNIPAGKAQFMPKELSEVSNNLEKDRKKIVSIVAENCGKQAEEIGKDMEETKGLNAEQAKDYGLVHEIKEELYPQGSEVITISVWPNA